MIADARPLILQAGGLAMSAWEMGQGPLVLCLHGFPDTPRTWRLMLPALAEAGFRAVAVTARGYEPACQPPDADYGLPVLAGDVAACLDALGAARCHLIGHDWGASIAYAAAAGQPGRICSLTTLAVPHPAAFAQALARDIGQMLRSWYMFYFQLRDRPERIIPRRDFAFLERLWRDWSPGWRPPAADLQAMKDVFAQPGVLAAALAYYRQAFDARSPHAAETARLYGTPVRCPTLALTGARDGCIAADVFERCMPPDLFPAGLTVRRIQDAGHFLHLEQPRSVAAAIITHLQGAQPGLPASLA